MYYRYKSRKRNRGITKILFIAMLAALVLYVPYHFRSYLLFWKYSVSKLEQKVLDAASQTDSNERTRRLLELKDNSRQHKAENQLSADAFLTSGRVHFLLGEQYMPGSFSEIMMHDFSEGIDPRARKAFLTTIRDIRKGIELVSGEEKSVHYLALAKAAYYTNFYPLPEIINVLSKVKNIESLPDREDIRFCAFMHIISGDADGGIELLNKSDKAISGIEGTMFLAASEMRAKRYTNAIIRYKQVLEKTAEPRMVKLARVSLGKIYFTQTLYLESQDQFSKALDADPEDAAVRIWLARSMVAAGDKKSAKTIVEEVLKKDQNNDEAKKLLDAI
jgi:tetratricopeptide (TPR) repeat protein